MGFFERAHDLGATLVAHRRYLHTVPEVGLDLPQTTTYLKEQLEALGCVPQEICQCGLTVTLGRPGKTILLRADTDGLPMVEESGLSFASQNGRAHTCGHDLHAAMMLGVAQLLKERESELPGTVKLMFQPGEEIFKGAQSMIEAGVLETPKVDCAIAAHVFPMFPSGEVLLSGGPACASCNGFRITITGVGSHGALPQTGVDPINIGAHLHLALQALITREIAFDNSALLTIGKFSAGEAANIIPATAVLEGTIRTYNEDIRNFLVERLREIAAATAKTFRGSAQVEIVSDVPAMCNDTALSEQLRHYLSDFHQERFALKPTVALTGSEDFAFIASQVPAALLFFGAGKTDGSPVYSSHHPKVIFDEDVIPRGAGILAELASRWLCDNAT